jgi:hypothetical protein
MVPVAPPRTFSGPPPVAPRLGSAGRQKVRDDWVAVNRRSRRLAVYGSRLRRALASVVALAVVTGGVMVAVTMSHSSPGIAGAQHRYDAGGWTFAADFPSAPKVTHFGASLGGKPYTSTFFSVVSPNSEMIVGVYPFPIGKPVTSARTFLRRELSGAAHSPVSVRLRPGPSTTVQGLPSVWLAPTFEGRLATYGVIVLDGHVAYEIVLKGPSATTDASLQQVVNTFRIIDPARARVF